MAIVVGDASIVLETLAMMDEDANACRDWLADILEGSDLIIIRNHTLLEVAGALRRLVRRELVDAEWAEQVLSQNADPFLERVDLFPADLRRVWELRHNHIAADAAYIALAERLTNQNPTSRVVVATADRRMTASPVATCLFEYWHLPPHRNP